MDKGISCIALTNTHLFTAAFDFTVIAWDISVKAALQYLALRPEVNVNVRANARIELGSIHRYYIVSMLYSCVCRTFTLTSGRNARYCKAALSDNNALLFVHFHVNYELLPFLCVLV